MPYLIKTKLGVLVTPRNDTQLLYALQAKPWAHEFYETLHTMHRNQISCDLCGGRLTRLLSTPGCGAFQYYDITEFTEHPLNKMLSPMITVVNAESYTNPNLNNYRGFSLKPRQPVESFTYNGASFESIKATPLALETSAYICSTTWGGRLGGGGQVEVDRGEIHPIFALNVLPAQRFKLPNEALVGYFVMPLHRQ